MEIEEKINFAKKELEADLKNKNMAFLIEMMSSRENYSPLIKEWRKNVTSSVDLISHFAYVKARSLNKNENKMELLELLKSKKYIDHKEYIYYALSFFCKNTHDIDLFNFLMEKLSHEKQQNCKINILLGIDEMNKCFGNINLTPIVDLIENRSKIIKISALRALKHTCKDGIEDILLNLFTTTNKSYIKDIICDPLKSIGTKKSIPILEHAYKKTRDTFLRNQIVHTTEEIRKRIESIN